MIPINPSINPDNTVHLPPPLSLRKRNRKYTFGDREFQGRGYKQSDPGTFDRDLVFVIMPIKGQEMDDVYAAIKDECARLGLRAARVDERVGSSVILREIISFIERAEFVICDLTYERPNVYYELGYAHGVGNVGEDILLIAKDGTTLHFDIAPLRVQYYRSTEHLRSILASNLSEMIRLTRK